MGQTTQQLNDDAYRNNKMVNDANQNYRQMSNADAASKRDYSLRKKKADSDRDMAEQSFYLSKLNSQGVQSSGYTGRGSSTWGANNTTVPGYDAPVYDTNRVEALAQRVAAPGVKKLRDQVQQVQGGVYENPNVKAMTLRQALGGYGSGLGDVMGGAFNSATGMYEKEYQPKVRAAEAKYQAEQEMRLQENRQSFEAWMKSKYQK